MASGIITDLERSSGVVTPYDGGRPLGFKVALVWGWPRVGSKVEFDRSHSAYRGDDVAVNVRVMQ